MATYESAEKFQAFNPRVHEAMQCVFVSDSGEIAQYVMTVEDWHTEIKTLMTRYVFVNGWKSIVHTIEV